jgi:RNA polymerase sigma-70 factor (ECF subfamily)
MPAFPSQNLDNVTPETAVAKEIAYRLDLVVRWKRGDQSAAQTLIDELYPAVSRVVRTYLSQRESEQDLAQEIFLKVFSRLHQFKGDSPLEHWVTRIARTTCIDRLRRNKVRPELRWADLTEPERHLLEQYPEPQGHQHPSRIVAARDLLDRLLNTLSPEQRQLIVMVDCEGQSLNEVSQTTGWGLAKIKMRLYRLRTYLREKLKRLEKEYGTY